MDTILLNHEDDLDWIESNFKDDYKLIAHEDYLPILLNKDIPSFYDHLYGSTKPEKEIGYFIQHWHRDESGQDLSEINGVSSAQILSVGFWHTLVGLYRDYYSIKYWSEKFDKIYISNNESNEFIELTKLFGNKFIVYSPGHNNSPIVQSRAFERVLGAFPRIDWKNNLLRTLQAPLLSLVKNKNIFYKDWGNKYLVDRQPGGIVIDSVFLWKGAYLSKPKSNYLEKAQKLIPEDINVSSDSDWIKDVLSRKNIIWDAAFLEVISNSLRHRYVKYRDYFINTIAVYMEFLDVYQPKNLILPGMTHEAYTISAQLARYNNIHSYLAVDGYHITTGGYFHLYDSSGSDYLFNTIVVYGKQHFDLLRDAGFKDDKLCLISPPLLDNHKNISNVDIDDKFDAIVMTSVPHARCPQGYLSSRLRILKDCLEAVYESGCRKIAVKIKWHGERNLFVEFLTKIGWIDKVEILEGMLFKHISKTNKIIGGISTAVGETAFHNIPYYVYEPLCNGYQEYELKSSKIIPFDKIARNKESLMKLLKQPNGSVNIDREYLFDGDDILPLS